MASLWDDYVSLSHDTGKLEAMSDKGRSVQRMIAQIDGHGNLYERRANNAIKFCRYHAPWAADVLREILKNGNNRKESIWSMLKERQSGRRCKTTTTGR